MSLAIGQVLQKRYRIISCLGQGGMGAVYSARHLNLNTTVAIKEMIPQPGLDAHTLAQLRRQFQQEAAVLAHLSHPHMVRVTDFFEEKGNAYLVMDLVEGKSLADHVIGQRPLPEREVMTWTKQLLDALAYCHSQGVIHRDIKPQNIVIRPDGRAMLVDFGLVKLWDPNDPRTKTAMRGMGTPEYAPPEQYDVASGHTDPRSDIYSLGATLYHLLTGQSPPTATQRMTNPASLEVPRALNPRLSTQTERVVLKAMEPQPSHRFQSAKEMAAALSRKVPALARPTARKRQPTKVKPKARSTGRAQGRMAGRTWMLVGLASLVLLLLGGAGVLWMQAQKGQGLLVPFLKTQMQVAWSPDGRWLAVASSLGISLRNAQTMTEKLFIETEAPAGSVAFAADGVTLASGLWDNTVQVWRISDEALLRTLEGHTDIVQSVAFSPDGTTLASGSDDGTVKVWRCADGTLLYILEHASAVKSVAFSPDGTTLASGSDDGTVKVWRCADRTLLYTLEHASAVRSVAFSPDGDALAAGYFDGTVRVFGGAED